MQPRQQGGPIEIAEVAAAPAEHPEGEVSVQTHGSSTFDRTRQDVTYRKACTVTAWRLLQDHIPTIRFHRRLHHFAANRHSVVRPGIASQATVKLARVDINVFATLVDCFVRDPVKLVTEIISGQRHHGRPFALAILAQSFDC